MQKLHVHRISKSTFNKLKSSFTKVSILSKNFQNWCERDFSRFRVRAREGCVSPRSSGLSRASLRARERTISSLVRKEEKKKRKIDAVADRRRRRRAARSMRFDKCVSLSFSSRPRARLSSTDRELRRTQPDAHTCTRARVCIVRAYAFSRSRCRGGEIKFARIDRASRVSRPFLARPVGRPAPAERGSCAFLRGGAAAGRRGGRVAPPDLREPRRCACPRPPAHPPSTTSATGETPFFLPQSSGIARGSNPPAGFLQGAPYFSPNVWPWTVMAWLAIS